MDPEPCQPTTPKPEHRGRRPDWTPHPPPTPQTLEEKIIDAHYRGARDGAVAAFNGAVGAEVRAFFEDYFDCLDKPELAAHLGISESTIKVLVAKGKIPLDDHLGVSMPRFSLQAVKAAMAASRQLKRKRPKLVEVPRGSRAA